MLARLACRRPLLALRPAIALRRLSSVRTPPRPDSRVSWAAYEDSRVGTAVASPPTDAAADDAAPIITTAALDAAASDPASDPALYARLEGYILTWADPSVITPAFLKTKWLRSLRRDIRRDLPDWDGTTGTLPEARPPAPKPRGVWADAADRTPLPPGERPGGKPALMNPDKLLSCLTRLADYGKLGDPDSPLRVAIERAFKERAMAPGGTHAPQGRLTKPNPNPNPRPSPRPSPNTLALALSLTLTRTLVLILTPTLTVTLSLSLPRPATLLPRHRARALAQRRGGAAPGRPAHTAQAAEGGGAASGAGQLPSGGA